jgi:uncharacterized protein (TIGR03067 family)
MRRTILLLAGVLLSVMALGSDSAKEYDDKTDYVGIEGTWRRTEIEFSGRKWNPDSISLVTFRGQTYTCSLSDGDGERGNFRIDPTRKPAHLDYIPDWSKGQSCKSIYQIEGDTLRVAVISAHSYTKRPQGFNDEQVIVLTYKRVK